MTELDFYKECISAASDMYISLHILDLQTNTSEAIKTNTYIEKWAGNAKTLQVALDIIMSNLAEENTRKEILQFTNLNTLEERFKENNVLTQVFCGKVNGWCQARFIRVEKEGPSTMSFILLKM